MSGLNTISVDVPASLLKISVKVGNENSIVIRPLALTDAPSIVEGVTESLPELKQFMPWSHFPQTIDSQRQRIIGTIQSYWLGDDYSFGVFGGDSGLFLGAIGFHRRMLNRLGLEIGSGERQRPDGVRLSGK